MNLWGGPAENRGVGLWDKGDKNNVVEFVDAESFAENLEKMSRTALIPYPNKLDVKDGELPLASLSAIAYTGAGMKEHAEITTSKKNTSIKQRTRNGVCAIGADFP